MQTTRAALKIFIVTSLLGIRGRLPIQTTEPQEWLVGFKLNMNATVRLLKLLKLLDLDFVSGVLVPASGKNG
jgi:hypothetical protein